MKNDLGFQEINESFLTFLKNNGATLSDHFVIEDYSNEFAARGIKAKKDLDPETELFTIPYQLCLAPDTSRIKSWVFNEPKLWEHEWAPSITAVLYELCFAESSFWKPYFDILPKELDSPIFWSNEELAHLQGTETLINLGKEECESLFTDIILPVLKKHITSDEMLKCITMEKFHFAGSLLMAYGFQWHPGSSKKQGMTQSHDVDEEDDEPEEDQEEECIPVLVPLADTLNADTPSSAHLVYLSETCITMKTSCFVPANHQIYNTYGERSSSERLRRYGYVEWNSKEYDYISFSTDSLVKVITEYLKKNSIEHWENGADIDKELNKRLRYLAKHGIFHESFDITFSSPMPDTLLITLRLLILPPIEWNTLAAKPRKLLNSCSKQLKYLSDKEFQILKRVGTLRLDQYPTTPMYTFFKTRYHSVTNMVDYLKQIQYNKRTAMAYFVRIQEMNVLERFFRIIGKKKKISEYKTKNSPSKKRKSE
ncbi:hypothetical protein HMI54_005743 [Coelomomyces lativittatus]|nr:hypothetical protein HMI54_005743 [Coelomomyces lativittatus]KAJ1505758.1 hypothetical protein HMI56_000955 [Coelomomyces lativittatus]KAJ1507602.1 hypothetical protein HMI55_000717 [Coelomomyces lativittatus]